MKKFKNRLRKLIVMLCTIAAFLCCSFVSVLANEEGTSSVNGVIGGFEVPYYPDEIYDNEYIILYYDTGDVAVSEYCFMLLVFSSDCQPTLNVPYWQIANNSQPLYIKGLSSGSAYKCYSYSFDDGWVKVDDFNGEVYIQSGAKISKTTVDLLLESDKSQVLVSANAEVIYKSDIKVFLDDFGGLLTGSIGFISSSIVGIVGAFIVIIPAVVGLFYALLRRN